MRVMKGQQIDLTFHFCYTTLHFHCQKEMQSSGSETTGKTVLVDAACKIDSEWSKNGIFGSRLPYATYRAGHFTSFVP